MRKPYAKGWLTKEEMLASADKDKRTGCWNWRYCLSKGYGNLRRHGRGWSAHRISYFLFNSDVSLEVITDTTIHICHKCDNRKCINPDHLFLGDAALNCADKVDKGRHYHGSSVWKAKLKEADIPTIFKLWRRGWTQQRIAEKYDIDSSAISAVINRINWKHVKI